MKIYTKTGDQGKTALFDGQRVAKSSPRICAYGNIDELNSFCGYLADKLEQNPKTKETKPILNHIQQQLFTLGSELATPASQLSRLKIKLINDQTIIDLEKSIDQMNSELKPLKNFILPCGHELISLTHINRTITRRCERQLQELMEQEEVRQTTLIYLNRLSDWFFIFARYLAHKLGVEEVKWQP